ncbi:nucleotidyltransferase domain-containing protein [Methanospirillum sp. J.3.6.1-F.2.7.3]|uniref:Nucleotidyltransferase domain-containing protein n=2 Tax=Methanospirillum purgamenti TaxID=2834276 RepID=A0A8E7B124_9EURY|nr:MULTISPECIES: nucleotidyltransferase domain-containing protein [Methanospirillum]MDX8551469.1 nucleotidyltransferase domain-containing protein [Methanospirillum hungatei]QVV88356.1 nucleotidyltransferase domain-containing protein [Methanospirillum sp. J.3.6.1-F.2.7.3]
MEIIKSLPEFHHIRFIILYGSVAEGKNHTPSDIDIAISTNLSDIQAERMRMHILGRVPDNFDIQIFEHLPLYVQVNVLKGEVLYVTDLDELYDRSLQIFREYDFFKPHYLDYIGERSL